MKKIILTAAAVAAFTTSSAYAVEEGAFYIKANAGWVKLNKIQQAKSNNAGMLGLGVGYYALDNLRAELIFDHYLNPNYKHSSLSKYGDKLNGKIKVQASSLMLNGFVDLFDASVVKVFAGAGVGLSMISGKLTFTNQTRNRTLEFKAKKKNNFAYALHLGASGEVSPGVNAELTYSFRDLGAFKKIKGDSKSLGRFKGHHVAAGIRFDI